jgi:ABC-type Fe3+ transport system substrate-binding protein
MLSSSITAGQARVGVSSFFNTDRAKKNGEPQDFRFFTDYVPINSLNVYVPEGSPNPNTARLFAAWLATEGVHIAEKFESLGRLSDPESAVAKAYAAQDHKGQIIEPKTDEDVVRTREISDKLTLLFTGRPQ